MRVSLLVAVLSYLALAIRVFIIMVKKPVPPNLTEPWKVEHLGVYWYQERYPYLWAEVWDSDGIDATICHILTPLAEGVLVIRGVGRWFSSLN